MNKKIRTLAVKLTLVALMVGLIGGGSKICIDPPGGSPMINNISIQAIDPPGGAAW